MREPQDIVQFNNKAVYIPEPQTHPFEGVIIETPEGVVYRKLEYFRTPRQQEPPKNIRKVNVLI